MLYKIKYAVKINLTYFFSTFFNVATLYFYF